jgi:hypothetical protein
MKRSTPTRAWTTAAIMALAVVLAACGGKTTTPAQPTVTVTKTQTSVSTVTVSASTTASTTTSTSSGPSTAIASIAISEEMPCCVGKRVGPHQYQETLKDTGIDLYINWKAKGDNGDVNSDGCTVVLEVTGPQGFDERRRSGACTGSTDSSESLSPKATGTYTTNISITPPDSSTPVTGTQTFDVIGYQQ